MIFAEMHLIDNGLEFCLRTFHPVLVWAGPMIGQNVRLCVVGVRVFVCVQDVLLISWTTYLL